MYAIKILLDNRLQFILTVAGIALCSILMLLLMTIYKGVADGSVQYVRSSNADLWVLQKHSNNILRSNSYLSIKHGNAIQKIEGVETVAPVFFLLVNVNLPQNSPTVYLAGYDPVVASGGPPSIYRGKNLSSGKEIVIDRAFARKHKIKVGDRIPLKKDSLLVSGISNGTNMFVIQYAFVTIEEAWSIAGIDDYVSCYQVRLAPNADKTTVAESIQGKLGNTVVFDQATFLENNLREMESGLLPLLFVVAFISAVVLTAILSLILTISVLEKRREYAILKALGAPMGFVPNLVVKQALFMSTAGLFLAIILFYPFARLIEAISPEVTTQLSLFHIAAIFVAVELLGIISVALPLFRLRSVYPLEVFQ